MILNRALRLVAAIAALAAAAAVCVVAAAYALFALARYYLGPAGASATIAIVAAIAAVVLAVYAVAQFKGPMRPKRREEEPLSTRLIELAREKPIIAAGAVAAAGLVLLRNPGVIGAIVSAAVAGRHRAENERDWKRRGKRRR